MRRRSNSRREYRPAPGVARYLCGTQPILALTALECGLDTVLAAEPFGGRRHGGTARQVAGADRRLHRAGRGSAARAASRWSRRASTRSAARRSASRSRDSGPGAYAIVQALIARGVIGDFRAGDAQMPDILRFGFTPLYLGFEDVWNAVEHLRAGARSRANGSGPNSTRSRP